MIESTSSFIKSSIPLYHNAVKSIIFKCAELLMGIFIFKLFALIAAQSNQFTSYLMFTEDYIQRTLYVTSRGLSRAGLVVLAFSLLNVCSGGICSWLKHRWMSFGRAHGARSSSVRRRPVLKLHSACA
ncbi:hypothetical protein BKA60DRAFT_585850 [Fusarium oxysporum]|nr:hypothetical protein BKA60DRAFT_585850 [Fusarium oxysporum]